MADPALERTVVIGTAGHIDHGKTSLLRALTGINADRLPEERARGMTIDVGYAHLAFDDGVELDFVDVPGHDRLIGNMLVGAGEIDAAMLVVAADDGPRPQTLEHLELLDALGIDAGIAVVTKVDMVDEARVAAVVAELETLLGSTALAGSPVLAASSTTGAGIEAVRAALRGVRDRVAPRLADDPPLRLAVDRAFAVKGRGAVVTGSLRGGSVGEGAALRREPGGDRIRVRAIQVHNQAVPGHAGGRTALNTTGVPVEALRRGDVLTDGGGPLAVQGTDHLLVDLRTVTALGAAPRRPPRRDAALRLHLGTDQLDARMRRVAVEARIALLALERETAAFRGARGVLREPASGAVVAGVTVLDVRPPRGISRRRMTADRLEGLAGAIERGDPVAIEDATVALHGARVSGRELRVAPDVRAALEASALELVAAHHRGAPMSAGLPLPRARAGLLKRLRSLATIERRDAAAAEAAVTSLVDELVASGRLARDGDFLRDPMREQAVPRELHAAMARLESVLSVPAPPALGDAARATGCPPEGVRALQAEGRIVRLGPDLAWATTEFHRLAGAALERARVEPLSPAAFRDATGTSRRYVLAILEDLDRRGILRRTEAGHVPGPRAPAAS
ncbi:MAG TPA: selenocysteine-specific translation elongation factor [Candidatus Dormibacteraeota bacterium]|nr:selenocysteine-specific translation elongation factor [Candidatus Dormibacteraeota bacterium]